MKFTDDQVIAALEQAESISAAARLLGANPTSFCNRVARMRKAGYALPHATVYPVMPPGQRLKGVSSLQKVLDPETGETVMQWIKTREDNAELEQQAAFEALKSELPRAEPRVLNTVSTLLSERLASLLVVTDYHMGMYSWAEETGAAWDMQIAEDLLVNWFSRALASTPDSALGILAQLGDFLHYDSLDAVTPTAKNQLDADSRAQKMIRVGIRVLRRCVNMMLGKFPRVIVLMAEGNHDIISSAWLREAFKVIYENEPRVTIDVRPDPYYAVQWGQTGLFFHHGHLKKVEQLDRVFARKFREIYGSSVKCYGHVGHMHHKLVVETALMPIEQHPTLAASDSHASRHGYMSDRAASVITYDREFGEVGRVTINPEMVKAGSLFSASREG
jgi:hypothetical protein